MDNYSGDPSRPPRSIPDEDEAHTGDVDLIGGSRPESGQSALLQQQSPDTPGEGHSSSTSSKRKRPSRQDLTYPRKRATKACRLCRARKTKCSNARPTCALCESLDAVCVYEEMNDLSKLDTASLVIIGRLDQILDKLDSKESISAPPPQTDDASKSAIQLKATSENRSKFDQESNTTCLKIPTCRTSPNAILTWPIFNGRYPRNHLNDCIFEAQYDETMAGQSTCGPLEPLGATTSPSIDLEAIPKLVELFLTRVHIKNPVVDIRAVRDYARTVSRDGPAWDLASCLVLLVCALGSVAQPFEDIYKWPDAEYDYRSAFHVHKASLDRGDSYFRAARLRFWLLDSSLLSTQCLFLVGVYQMYLVRPLRAWKPFTQASTSLLMYLKCQESALRRETTEVPTERRRQEISLYWTCYKSECEFRTELPMPDSCLAEISYPFLFPTPPAAGSDSIEPNVEPHMDEIVGSMLSPITQCSPQSQVSEAGLDRLQQQAWYYYLTEITLRRIGNRVMQAFYSEDHQSWQGQAVYEMIKSAEAFEGQLSDCYDSLPDPIRFVDSDPNAEHELIYMTQRRALEIKSWLYRPFLYYAAHYALTTDLQNRIKPYVQKAVDCCIYAIQGRGTRHRHHGTWYSGRAVLSAALLLIAAVKAQLSVKWHVNWRTVIRQAISVMKFWAVESVDFARGKALLEELVDGM